MMTDAELVEQMNRRRPPTSELLGTEILEVDAVAGRVRLSFEARPEFMNPGGSVQGGMVTAMLDDAAATACIVHAGRRIFVPTLELKVSFLAPAREGKLFAEGRVVKAGRTIAFLEADLFDGDGKHLARMTTTAAPRAIEMPTLVERA
jgi:uncharacterized protein (TIGR00369 family)